MAGSLLGHTGGMTALIRYDAAKRALAAAHSVDEVRPPCQHLLHTYPTFLLLAEATRISEVTPQLVTLVW